MGLTGSSRRQFLQSAAVAVGVPWFVPGMALGADGNVAASERIALGFIGVGNQGSANMRRMMSLGTTQVVAVCDPFRNKRSSAKQTAEAYYAKRSGGGTYKGCGAYNDFRELVARDDIDAVGIASPGHWHGIQSVAALNSGKDVYCEKPLTVTIDEGQAVCRAVRRSGRVFQTGTQQRSGGHFRFACELAQNGYLGKLHTVKVAVPGGTQQPAELEIPAPPELDYDMWVGPAPMIPYTQHRCANVYGWMLNYNFVIGFISGWGVHHLDIALWGMGDRATGPVEVQGTGALPNGGLNDTWLSWLVELKYADGLKLSFSNNGNPHPMGCRFEGDKGWVFVSRRGIQAQPESLLKVAIQPNETHLYQSNDHHVNFLQCVKNRHDPVAPVEAGHAATTLCNLADIALRLKQKVTWDPAAGSFVGNPQANRMRTRAMRGPWSI